MQKKFSAFRTVASLIAGLLIFVGIVHRLDQMYVKVETDAWNRILWHHFYADEGKIDNIYLGSSHVYCDIDPIILDQLSGQYNFNLSTPSQPLNESYYLLREADRLNELSHVYLELYYACNYHDEKILYNDDWRTLDHMDLSLNKAAYGLARLKPDQCIEALFPFSRYRILLGDYRQIKRNMDEKSSGNYRKYQYERVDSDGITIEVIKRQGAYKNTRKYTDSRKLFQQDKVLTDYSIGKRSGEYLCKIIEYCRKDEIPITLFVSPISDLQLTSTLDYDDYVREIRELASAYEVPFYDFNLVREDYLPIQQGEYFMDAGHLNQYGAELFTPFFYQVVNGKETDNRKYFCDTYEERLRDSAPAVFGVYEQQAEEEDENRTLWVASNRGTEMEYRITIKPDGKRRRQIQDFQENMSFQVPLDEHGICTIAARVKETPVEMRTMSIRY